MKSVLLPFILSEFELNQDRSAGHQDGSLGQITGTDHQNRSSGQDGTSSLQALHPGLVQRIHRPADGGLAARSDWPDRQCAMYTCSTLLHALHLIR